MGPRHCTLFAGKGLPPSYEGAAEDYWTHFCLCTVDRLRMMTYLCVQGPASAGVLAEALRIGYTSVHHALWNMKSTKLVECRERTPLQHYPRWRGGVWRLDWEVTDWGRMWLWRFGWVSRRVWLNTEWHPDMGFHGTLDEDPCEVLRQYAQPSLMRPVWLAAAAFILDCSPVSVREMERLHGWPKDAAGTPLKHWIRLGWLEKCERAFNAIDRFRGKPARQAPRWRFNRAGACAIAEHVDALRWAAQHSGYEPLEDDVYLLDQDGPHWIHIEIIG